MTPTSRFWSFLAASIVFWFFANQTQVGWLYVVSAILGGVLIAAFILNRGALRQVSFQRNVHRSLDEALHEGDDLTITLTTQNKGNLPASHLALTELCPLASPESELSQLPIFIPTLPDKVDFSYIVQTNRRGLHTFPPIKTRSRAPFGFFERRGQSQVDTSVLVYPELRKLTQLSLLDEHPAAELTNPKAGIGSEVIGVRPYRAGDSLRHIHWRSVARRGQLVSKEFAQETQPGISIVLDRYCPLDPLPDTKHQPFEISVKSAVSVAEYALRKGYPVHLVADNHDMAVPQGALVWDVIMQYSARVMPTTQSNLSDVMSYQPMQQFIAIVLSWVDETVLETVYAMKHRGYNLLVIAPDPASYPIETTVSAKGMVSALEQNGIATRLIQHGDDWSEIISHELQPEIKLDTHV